MIGKSNTPPSSTMRVTDGDMVEHRHVERVMGTVFSITVLGPAAAQIRLQAAVVRAVAWLHEVDDRFTTYRPGSEWLQVVGGDLDPADAHADIRHVLATVEQVGRVTHGAFSIHADLDRDPDPAAYVKGWATQRATDLLRDAGASAVCVNGGGDVAVHGGERPWRIGIQDPFVRDGLRGVVELIDGGVATSGRYERGDHLFDPRRGAVATGFAGVTVVGPDLGLADAYATALFAGGPDQTGWFDPLVDYGAYLIHPDATTTTIGL